MIKKRLANIIPNKQTLKQHKHLQVFGKLHLDPNLWHFNRHAVARAFSVGLFTAFMPVPFQMLMAATLAILFRAHLPISVALVWISNPLTYAPIFFFAYKLGAYLLSITPEPMTADTALQWISLRFGQIWKPLIYGLFTCAIVSAILGNILVRISWRMATKLKWRRRRHRPAKKPASHL